VAGVAQDVGFGVGLVLAEIQQRSDGIKGRVMRGRIIALENLVEPFGRLILEACTRALERRLSDALGLKVSIAHRPTGAGEVRVRYGTLEQLDDVIAPLAPGVGFQRL